MNKFPIAFLFILITTYASGQETREAGFPFLKNFAPADYRAHAQNFAITADQKGFTYFGNFAGILQYDGETWRLVPTEKTTRVSALATDAKGTVYAGAWGEIGYLTPDAHGRMVFRSLPGLKETVADITHILTTRDRIFFISKHIVYILKDNQITTWSSPGDIIAAFCVNEQIYLQVKGTGLTMFGGDRLTRIGNSDLFSEAVEIRSMLPYPGNRILVATGTQGLYLLESGSINPLNVPANRILAENHITCGILLSDGTYSFGTFRAGIVIMHASGSIRQVVDRTAGLRNNFIQALFAGNANTLWAALNNGISMIQIPGPLTSFDDRAGLSGAVRNILRFDQTLYVATYMGLYWYDESAAIFRPVNGIKVSCYGMIPFGQSLLAATTQGVYLVSNKNATQIHDGFVMAILRSSLDPSIVYTGETDGLYKLRQEGNRRVREKVGTSPEEIRDLHQDKIGNIWGSTLSKGIFRYFPSTGKTEFLTNGEGLPDDPGSSVNVPGDRVLVTTRHGVYLFNEQAGRFDSVNLIADAKTASGQWFSLIIPATGQDLWVTDGNETNVMRLRKEGSSYRRDPTPFLPIADFVVWSILPEDNGVAWFGGPDGLIRFDPSVANRNMEPFPTLIRMISVNVDSVLYEGDMSWNDFIKNSMLTFDYAYNSLRFDFASPFYNPKGRNSYSYFLDGFDETWSDWNMQSHKEYTNLPAGKYTFHVKARNIFGNISPEASVSFVVRPPWYATVWAYGLYFLFAAAIIYLIVIVRNQQLVREKRSLEQRIAERTAEVVQQKEEIQQQSEELANKNDELERINTAVKSINAEIKIENLIQAMLEKMKVIRAIENAAALVYDKETNLYRFTASIGYNLEGLRSTAMTFSQAESRYLKNTEEVFEDIFVKTDFSGYNDSITIEHVAIPKSLLVLVIRVDKHVEAFLAFSNLTRANAFEARDISFIKNSKEHIISAFIRTRIMEDLRKTLQNLKDTQDQLVQSEKLASLGELTAGIAHEIQNPLNFVNNFSSLSAELADELFETIQKNKALIPADEVADLEEVIGMIKGNVKKINEHGKRAESIVKGMLQHSRGKTGEFETVEINNMVAEYVNLAYHGMRAKDKSFNTAIRTNLDPQVGSADVIPQDISRVILNIVNNACYAVGEKSKKQLPGYHPEVIVSTFRAGNKIEIHIRDNGTGMPESVKEKIFNPFFTTKPTGKGTGLGLSMSFDIVNQIHKGKLEVLTQEGEFTEFIITIPDKQV